VRIAKANTGTDNPDRSRSDLNGTHANTKRVARRKVAPIVPLDKRTRRRSSQRGMVHGVCSMVRAACWGGAGAEGEKELRQFPPAEGAHERREQHANSTDEARKRHASGMRQARKRRPREGHISKKSATIASGTSTGPTCATSTVHI
jgi:hypothetical protein